MVECLEKIHVTSEELNAKSNPDAVYFE